MTNNKSADLPHNIAFRQAAVAAAGALIGSLLISASAISAPRPGPRPDYLKPFYHALRTDLPEAKPEPPSPFSDFIDSLSTDHAKDGTSCCDKGDCREVGDADGSDNLGGGYYVTIPANTFPAQEPERYVFVKKEKVVTPSNKYARPEHNVVCADPSGLDVWCLSLKTGASLERKDGTGYAQFLRDSIANVWATKIAKEVSYARTRATVRQGQSLTILTP